jgi:hypothetical protein
MLIGYASLHRPEGAPVVARAHGLFRRPEPGGAAWLAFHGDAGVVRAGIRSSEPSEYPEGAWDARLELPEATASALLGERPSLPALLLWPASGAAAKAVQPAAGDAPYGVLPESIQIAVDSDGDGRADVLELSYCCKQPSQTEACEYICGGYWQKTGKTWVQCESTQPE